MKTRADNRVWTYLDALAFMRVFEKPFGVTKWTCSQRLITAKELKADFLKSMEEDKREAIRDGWAGPYNFPVLCYNSGKPEGISASFQIHPTEPFAAYFSFGFTDENFLPPVSVFSKAVKVIEPADATVSQVKNWEQLNGRERSLALDQRDIENRPAMLHWWHYVDEKYVANLGGLDHVLKTPIYSVKPLLNGVVFQITKDYFDPANPEHLAAQRTAMEYLGIWDYEPWVPPKRTISRRPKPPTTVKEKKAAKSKAKEKSRKMREIIKKRKLKAELKEQAKKRRREQ